MRSLRWLASSLHVLAGATLGAALLPAVRPVLLLLAQQARP